MSFVHGAYNVLEPPHPDKCLLPGLCIEEGVLFFHLCWVIKCVASGTCVVV